MLWTLIEVGGLIFWLLVGALVVWELICIEYDKRVGSWMGLVLFVLAIWLFGNFDLIHFIKQNWSGVLLVGAGYFAAGTLWGFGKWEFWTSKRRNEFDDFKQSWLDSHNIREGSVPPHLQTAWTEAVVEKYGGYRRYHGTLDAFLAEYPPERVKSLIVPRVRDHKARVLFWMTHWPFSLFWTLFRDVLAEVWNFIYYKVARLMDRRAQAHFKGVDSEFAVAKPAEQPAPQQS